MKHKTVDIEIIKAEDNGGEIVISTGAVDRDKDTVNPFGAKVENYLKNPVVQWGHNYRDPWATIGKTTNLQVDSTGLKATFELRDAVNEADPQNVILQLWNDGWIKAASIGFNPNWDTIEENDKGGYDFNEWELLEWSLVPIPANQEALRLAVKGLEYETTISLPTEPTPKPATTGIDDNIIAHLNDFMKELKKHYE